MKLPSSCIKVKEKQIGVGRMEVRFEFQREDCIHLYFAWTAILQNCVVYILQRFSWGLCKSGRVARKCKSWAARTLNFPEPTKTHWPCFCAHRYPQLVKRQWREEETPPRKKKVKNVLISLGTESLLMDLRWQTVTFCQVWLLHPVTMKNTGLKNLMFSMSWDKLKNLPKKRH